MPFTGPTDPVLHLGGLAGLTRKQTWPSIAMCLVFLGFQFLCDLDRFLQIQSHIASYITCVCVNTCMCVCTCVCVSTISLCRCSMLGDVLHWPQLMVTVIYYWMKRIQLLCVCISNNGRSSICKRYTKSDDY